MFVAADEAYASICIQMYWFVTVKIKSIWTSAWGAVDLGLYLDL